MNFSYAKPQSRKVVGTGLTGLTELSGLNPVNLVNPVSIFLGELRVLAV
jgi:hypothetical protein